MFLIDIWRIDVIRNSRVLLNLCKNKFFGLVLIAENSADEKSCLLSLQSHAMQLRDQYFTAGANTPPLCFIYRCFSNLSDKSSSDRCTEQNAECLNQRESDTVTLGEKD